MRRAADPRRAQATAEHLLLVLAVAAALALVILARGGLAATVAAALSGDAPPDAGAERALTQAIAGGPGAPSPLGARAWLAESVGEDTAERMLEEAVLTHLATRYPGWDGDVPIGTVAIAASAAVHPGRTVVRVVDHAEELRHSGSTTTPGARARAGALALLWDGSVALGHRIARPLGLALSGLRLVAESDEHDPLPPGARAGDVVVCRPVLVARRSPLRGPVTSVAAGWRVAILRDGRVQADGLSADDRACRAPAP